MGHCVAWIPIIQVLLASSVSHQCPCWGGLQRSGRCGSLPTGEEPRGNWQAGCGEHFRLHYLSDKLRWGEGVRCRKGNIDSPSGASWWSRCCDGQTGCPALNASKGRQGLGNVVCLGDAPRKHKGGSRTGRQRREQGKYRVNYTVQVTIMGPP